MNDFAQLVFDLETSNKRTSRLHALMQYFSKADATSKIWAIAILKGQRPRRLVKPAELKIWAQEKINLPSWLLLDSFESVGDPMETISILLPKPTRPSSKSLNEWTSSILDPRSMSPIKEEIFKHWEEQNFEERFIYNKLITGTFRLTLPESLIAQALAEVSGTSIQLLSLKIHSEWNPVELTYGDLINPDPADYENKLPIPPVEIKALEGGHPEGDIDQWHIVKQYVGLDCQVIVAEGQLYIWHNNTQLITKHFPELEPLIDIIPDDSILIGQLTSKIARAAHEIQTRLTKKTTSKKQKLSDAVCLVVRDIIKLKGKDLGKTSISERWDILESWLAQTPGDLMFTPEKIQRLSWSKLFNFTDFRAGSIPMIGLIISMASSVLSNVKKEIIPNQYFWPLPSYSTNAVLLYARSEQGGRASHFSEYTFAVWNGADLVPFARVTPHGFDQNVDFINSFILQNTIEKFGPARSVEPILVFEIQFDRVQESKRHKCGLSVINPRIKVSDQTLSLEDVSDLKDLQLLLPQ